MTKQCGERKPVVSGVALGVFSQDEGGDPAPLLNTGESIPGVLCLVLCSPI